MIFLGLLIGFYGYIFPGNINLMFVELYRCRKYRSIFLILLLALIFESIYLFISFRLLGAISSKERLFTCIQYISYGLILCMGIWMLLEKTQNRKATHLHTLYRGIISIIVHPQQIPFWLVTGLLIHSRMLFSSDNTVFYGFLFCNAAGALAAFIFYMLSGKLLLDYFKLNTGIINKGMGVLYIGLFIYEISGIF